MKKKYGFEQLMTVTVKFVLTSYVNRTLKEKLIILSSYCMFFS